MAELRPSIDYMAKDYESFRQLMLDRLSATLPGWQERHAPDLGIALVETLAYVADYLSYYQDAVATEAYIGTARQRISMRRHARLLDYIVHEGCNARAWVHCSIAPHKKGDPPCILNPKTVMFVAIGDRPGAELPLHSEKDLKALAEASYEIFQPVGSDPIELHPNLNEMKIVSELKKGATTAEIKLEPGTAPKPGSVLIFRGKKKTGSGPEPDGSSFHYHAVALDGCSEAARAADATHSISWHIDDAIPDAMDSIDMALGNIVLVDHGRSLLEGDSDLAVQDGRASRPLSRRGLTHRVVRQMAGESAAAMIVQNPRQGLPEITLKIDGKNWGRVKADLLESLPSDPHFCIEVDDDGQAWIRFGDGDTGEQLPDKTAIKADYRVGNGEAGNVQAGTIKRMIFRDGASGCDVARVTVTNPIGASGGTEPESTASARLLAPGDMRVHQHRAISAGDYEEFARGVPGVANAVATIVQEGTRHIVRVAVDPRGWLVDGQQRARWAALKRRVLQRLEPVRRINHDVIAAAPAYVALTVHLRVTVLPSYVAETVRNQAKLELLGKDEKSFFDNDNLTFGQSIYWSQVASRLHSIPGVATVEQIRFGRDDRPRLDGTAIEPADKIEIGPHEIAVLLDENLVVDSSGAGVP